MAEIKVEHKKKAPIWPWIIGILILLGLIWLLVEAFDEEADYSEEPIEEGIETDEVGSRLPNSPERMVLNIYQDLPEQKVA